MLKKPSGLVPPSSMASVGVLAGRPAAMEVESTKVQTLPDGKKMIDVTLRRPPSSRDHGKLVVPQFDDDESSSSSSDDDDDDRRKISMPQHESPANKQQNAGAHPQLQDRASDNNEVDTRASFQGEFAWTGVVAIQSLTHENAGLLQQVDELKTQLKTQQIQLEALAPVPGFNAASVENILLDKDGTEHDIRDTKIVHQAKTLRHLKRSLQREKQLAVDAARQCKAMATQLAAVENENETLKLKLARFQARACAVGPLVEGEAMETPPTVATAKDKEALAASKKKYEDMRIKHDKLLADLKKTQRALLREVGDDVSLEELVDGTCGSENAKRGRAQQIIMLKAKVKKLEQELAKSSSAAASGEPSASSNGSTVQNVDQRALQDLSGQHTQKQRMLDRLTAERDELQGRLHQLTSKFDGLKSRTQILEKEKQDNKSKLQVLVDKSRNDDALVDALQRQLETWKGKLQEAKRARTAESSSMASGGGGGGGGLPKDERLELDRLRAILADFKRQPPSNQGGGATYSNSNGFMPPPGELAQYRAISAEKERLVEQVKALQAQLEDKEKQIRGLKTSESTLAFPQQSQPLPASRIPRLSNGSSLPSAAQMYLPAPPADVSATDVLRKSFRDAMVGKEQEVETLKLQIQQLSAAQQDAQDLTEENEYLRHEFDRLKTRYEAVVKNAKSATQ